MSEWKPHLERERPYEEENTYYSISINPEYGGWKTDSASPGYGLPLELAQWICDLLNKHGKDCPYIMEYGQWIKKGKAMSEDQPTEFSIDDIEKTMNFLMNMEIKMKKCFKCSKNFFPNYNYIDCDECYFSQFPEEEVQKFYRSLIEKML